MTRYVTLRLAAIVALSVAVAATAWANGDEFFSPAPTDQAIQLVYTGQIRDKETHRPIRTAMSASITDTQSGLHLPFTNDTPGHYRSPDLRMVQDITGSPADPETLKIQVSVEGYKTLNLTKLPRKNTGLVALDLQLERDPAVPVPASESPDAAPRNWGLLAAGGVVAMIIAGLAARTLSRRQPTAR